MLLVGPIRSGEQITSVVTLPLRHSRLDAQKTIKERKFDLQQLD
jgi:hypothetical protein